MDGPNLTIDNNGKLTTAASNPSGHIKFNPQQQAALEDMVRWINDPNRGDEPYLLQGYAGTGKTTLVRQLLEMVTIPLARIALVAPTNRAAKVLGNKTGLHTGTIHKLIYLTVREELEFQRERLQMWSDAKNFTDLADLIIEADETNLEELFLENGGGNDGEFITFVEAHRIKVLKYEGVTLPDDPAQRLSYFNEVRKEALQTHKDNITDLLQEDLKVRKKEPSEVTGKYSLILVDEASMVNETVGADLVSYRVPVILVGDPFQLPPVKAKPYWHGKRAQSVLTRIERQKGTGAGIPLAGERLRQGKAVETNESIKRHKRQSLDNEVYLAADQIISGTHKTREKMCGVVRKLLGHTTAHPQVGEKVVAVYNDRQNGIMNGELYIVEKVSTRKDGALTVMDIRDPYGKVITDVVAWTEGFAGRTKTEYLPSNVGKFWWGYCITCHQSQGSEWKHVVVCDDWPGKDDKDRWVYTAITRASEYCDLIQ
jgi:exodeoxyribonuclease-5